jgi:type IX secretion system PorP/SprF family membrane protein
MLKIKFIIIVSFLLMITNVEAQQFPVYSQYVFNEYMVNSAVAGTMDHTPIRLSYRDQWSGFTDLNGNGVAPKTFAVSAHSPISNHLGLGAFLYSDVTGPISQTAAQLSYSWRTCLSKKSCFWDKKKFMSLSYGTRFIQFAYDDTQTIGWNEYFGLENDPVLPNTIETDFLMSHTVSSYFYTEYFYVGLSAQNLFAKPLNILSNIGFDNKLTPEYNFVAGAYIPFNEDKSLGIEPSILTKTTSWSETQLDLSLRVIYLNSIWTGISYRTAEQAYALLFGFEFGDMFIGYSYDTAVQGISSYTGGTHEIAIGINIGTFTKVDNVRLKSRFKNRRMLLNPFKRSLDRFNRRGSGS